MSGVVLLLMPLILFTALMIAISYLGYSLYIDSNPYISIAVADPSGVGNQMLELQSGTQAPEDVEYTPVEEGSLFDTGFPVIPYASQWAVLNVEGWSRQDIPVYFGDLDEILNIGAGMWIGSHFCGQNAKIVISAHVMTDFYELEDVEIGTMVTMDTIYGTYRYRVREKTVFDYHEDSHLRDKGEGDVLFLYTCYPRSAGLAATTDRLGVTCELVEGYEYEAYQNQ